MKFTLDSTRRAAPVRFIAVGTLVAALSFSALANGVGGRPAACFDRQEILQMLSHIYSERRIALGLDSRGVMIEVFASKKGETFTILATVPGHATCVVFTGENWRAVRPDEPRT